MLDGQVVLGPIPQFSQILVVQRIEGKNTERDRGRADSDIKYNERYAVCLTRRGEEQRGEDLLCLKMLPPDNA